MKTPEKTVEQLLEECVCFDLRRTTRRISNLYDQIIAPSGVTSPQWSLLRTLDGQSVAIAKLSTLLDVDRTSLRRMLDPLERDGLVVVVVDPFDKRGRLVGLTPTGRGVLKLARQRWQDAQAAMLDVLGESDLRQLVSLLRKTNRAIRESTKQSG